MGSVEAGLRLPVRWDGRDVVLGLRIPASGRELPLLLEDHVAACSPALQDQAVGLIAAEYVADVDGVPPPYSLRRSLAEDPATRGALLRRRRELLETIRDEGRVYLLCPACGTGESVVNLVGLAIATGRDPWPVADPARAPVPPSLSTLWPAGSRPADGPPAAAGARLALPCALLGLDAPFREAMLGAPITADRDAEAWRRWGREGLPLTDPHAHWTYSNAGFRAILRFTQAMDSLDALRDITPEQVESIPIADFGFVDTVWWMLRNVAILDPDRCTVSCPACGERFLAVL